MEFKPGDILYRKYSDKNDLYCVITSTNGPFNIGYNPKFVKLFSYYTAVSNPKSFVNSEMDTSVSEWYVKVDLNNYDIKDKFLNKIKKFLDDNLGKIIHYETVLDNLLYIEILAELKKYEKPDIKNDDK